MTSRSRLAASLAASVLAVMVAVAGCAPTNIAAKVDGRPIKMDDITRQLDQIKKSSPQSFQGTDAKARELDYKVQILSTLIQIELVKETADKLGVKVDQSAIDAYTKQLETGYGGKSGLDEAMKQSGITQDQLTEAVTSRLLIDAVSKKVTKAADITDAQAQDYYGKNLGLFSTPAQYHAEQILLADKDKALAEQLFDQVKKGGDFAALAKKNSTDPASKDNGGDLGWKAASSLGAQLSADVTAMKPGEVRLVHSQFGYHVVKLLESKPAAQKTFAEVKSQIVTNLASQARSEEFTKYIADLKKKATIEVLDPELKKAYDAASSGSATGSQATSATQ